MGYTNYYYQERDFTDNEWELVEQEAKYLEELGYDIKIISKESATGDFSSEPILYLNGDCETLVLRKQRRTKKDYDDDNLSFDFCKTRMAQYDLAVWYLLCSCNHLLGKDFRISRDR